MADDPQPLAVVLDGFFDSKPKPEEQMRHEWAVLLEWDTTPWDLRDPKEQTLAQICEKHGFKPKTVTKWRQDPRYREYFSRLAKDRGLLHHQIHKILEVQYAKALAGETQAAKFWEKYYPADFAEIAALMLRTPSNAPSDVESTSLDDLSDEELDRLLEE